MSTTFSSTKEKDPSGIEVIGQKINIRAQDDEDEEPMKCNAPPIPIKQNFRRSTVKRYMPRKGSPVPQSGTYLYDL